MRYSAMQENSYGAELSESQLSNSAHENAMDATSDMYAEDTSGLTREEGSMVSNLPLLFANGYPTSLEKITMAQLERFISFMVHCSLGHDTTEVINKPVWWPQDVKFSSPLIRPKKINDNWMANLKKLVFRCYTYHRNEYLLRFCSYLAQYPHEELEYVNNWDSTTSLYHKSTGKLLVTFRNENMNYDKKSDNTRRTLLSHNGASSGYSNKVKQQNTPMMVQPPCDDIYLCDNCDAELVGLEKMKEHEKICCEQDHGSSGSRPSTPDISTVEPELQQNQFLEYFHLSSNKTEVKSIETGSTSVPDINIARRTSRRVRGSVNFTRCATIPFSSPAGMVLAKKSKAMTQETQQERLDRIERHVIAPVLTNSCRPKWLDAEVVYDRWIVTHKQCRDKPVDNYVHQYNFSNSYKKKPMLSIRSQLLYIVCRPIYVALTRLNLEQIAEIKQNSLKYQSSQNNNIGKVTSMKRIGPACKTKLKEPVLSTHTTFASSKRKAPGDETDLIVEENESSINTSAATTKEALTAFATVESFSTDNAKLMKSVEGKKSLPTNTIMIIDLCSSDEEDNLSTLVLCDENRDPMNSTGSSVTKSLLRKLTPNKLYTKPCIYPTESSADWLSNNILNKDKHENCTNKCRTDMLNGCAHRSPILRPAP